jgi:hypothetical protein
VDRTPPAVQALQRYAEILFPHLNGDGFTTDEDGQELPDIHAARAAAIAGLRDIMASELKDGVLKLGVLHRN